MEYLLRTSGKKLARAKPHIWCDGDTACRMFSTGGIRRKDDYTVTSVTGGREICHMCRMATVADQLRPPE
jgi:hypothetical protein